MASNRRKDYYATLGVTRNAKPAAIRTAYRHLARKLHPDVNPGDMSAESRFKEIQEAYGVLKQKDKRAFYDRHGFYSDQAFKEGAGPRPGQGRSGGFGFDGFDFSDFGRQAGSGPGPDFETVFNSIFGGSRTRRPSGTKRREGEDIEYTLDIGFSDAIRGKTVRLNVGRQTGCAPCGGSGLAHGGPDRQCETCNGSGSVHQPAANMRFTVPCPACRGMGRIRTPCPSCGGEGRVRTTDAIGVRIPPGTGQNSRIRVPGKGNAGLRGGTPGDLYIVAKIGKHPFFKRDGSDISIQVPVTPAEAVLGAKIEVPTIDGKALMRIPPGTSSGQTFRVRGRGVAGPRGARGDQFVRISIVVPKVPDENTKDLMREYAERNPENPRESILRST